MVSVLEASSPSTARLATKYSSEQEKAMPFRSVSPRYCTTLLAVAYMSSSLGPTTLMCFGIAKSLSQAGATFSTWSFLLRVELWWTNTVLAYALPPAQAQHPAILPGVNGSRLKQTGSRKRPQLGDLHDGGLRLGSSLDGYTYSIMQL